MALPLLVLDNPWRQLLTNIRQIRAIAHAPDDIALDWQLPLLLTLPPLPQPSHTPHLACGAGWGFLAGGLWPGISTSKEALQLMFAQTLVPACTSFLVLQSGQLA